MRFVSALYSTCLINLERFSMLYLCSDRSGWGIKAWNPDQNDAGIFKTYLWQIFEHPSKYGKALKHLYFTNDKSSKHYLETYI